MFRLLQDPRAALFGLTLFSNANPGLEKKLENFAQILEATRNSITAIRSEMSNYETSMYSLTQPPKAPKSSLTTQPVHPVEDTPQSYAPSEPYQENYQMPVSTMEVKRANNSANQVKTRLEKQIERFLEEKPDTLDHFLKDIEEVIKKYR